MENCYPLREGNIGGIRFKTAQCVRKKKLLNLPFRDANAEVAHSGKWAIMGCTLEDPSLNGLVWSEL